MDGNRFDALTRRLATGHTRRAVFQGLVGGGVLAATGAGATQAKPAEKVTICHKPGTPDQATLTVSGNAVDATSGTVTSSGGVTLAPTKVPWSATERGSRRATTVPGSIATVPRERNAARPTGALSAIGPGSP